MSLPLWLADGVGRMSELTRLFDNAGALPWVFPRLRHVFQWHLATRGNRLALREVGGLSKRHALGIG
jgi:hypothetical protein